MMHANALAALCLREKGYDIVTRELTLLPTTVELCVKATP